MNKLAFLVLLLSILISCESESVDEEISTVAMIEAESIADFTCINEQADNAPPVSEAKNKVVGDWQLKAILTMLPSNEIPNIVLRIDNELAVSVFQAGVIVHADNLKITGESGTNYSILKLESSRENFSNGDFNFLYGNLRVCDNELFIDNGIAFDAPGYYFRKK